jgi:predicted HicB family RNase H-like nuclease
MAEEDTKDCMVVVRFKTIDIERIATVAKAHNLSVSEWIRSTLNAEIAG